MLGVKSVDWISHITLGHEGHIHLNSDCLRQSCGSKQEDKVVCWVALTVLPTPGAALPLPGASLPLFLLVVPPRVDVAIQQSGPAWLPVYFFWRSQQK